MFDSLTNAPVLAFAFGALAVLALAVPLLLWLVKRMQRLQSNNVHLASDAEQGREILAAAPDGLFMWDHAKGEERCSRRLAVLLGLNAGTGARFTDVQAKFDAPEARALERAVNDLHGQGASFDLLLKLGGRTIQATGTRASTIEGKPLDDLMWMRDVSEAPRPQPQDKPSADTAAHEHFHQLLDTLPMAVWIRDGNLDVVFSNRAAATIAASDDSRALAAQARTENRQQTQLHTFDMEAQPKQFQVSEVPARGWSGTIGFAREYQAQNTQSELKVLDNLSTAIAIFGPERRLTFCNDAYASLWRFDPDWLAGEPSLSEILDRLRERRQLPEVADFRAFKEQQNTLFDTLDKAHEELLHLPDGRTLRCVVTPHEPAGLVYSYEDVSDRLALERSFKTLNAVQRETLDNLYEGIAVFGSDGRMKLSNPAFAELWNLGEPVLAGDPHLSDIINATRPLITGIEDSSDEKWQAYVKDQVAQFSGRQAAGGRLQLSDGAVLEYSSVPLPDGAVLLSYLDVSDSARVEAALRQRAEALSQANRLKSEFIANVSYEVRTPLTTLKGFADILAQEYFGDLNVRQKEYCQGILDSAQGLTNVINDILDMASIEAGMMTLELDTVEIHSMLASVLNLTNERARRKSLEIDFDCPPDIGWIVADEKRLKQVLFYLLSNAVNVSPARGTVHLQAVRSGEKDNAFVSFMITSLTSGVSQAEQLDIFSTFDNAGNAATPSGEGVQMGVGLGLSLVQRFVELHGGEVQVKSPQGRGTTITCRLPATGAGAAQEPDLSVVSG
ncbi:MAG: PAS domain-containing protein [Rhodospirillaceae bacterium]|nr:PAS domain-containing protein [Rhodospirillaceae bacterium]MBT5244959.1 PAS domain-containing protein [Rhodospirillaceae bacterium]MBT5562652.1 PAS domain-containing protein [Rhodospirillaceae bacterium]MBT6243040.1 PAS domain-containing protein [Rhodospirillaceae bacterium]MBT7136973.1 PAS domain-containing protein [Rhodospirillaceae bacterium]